MNIPPKSSLPPTSEDREFREALMKVEGELLSLKERYEQVQRDQLRQAELKHLREVIWEQQKTDPLPQLKTELTEIKKELELLEFNLESRLFTWSTLKEPFWQAVRFGGLGVVLGWFFHAYK